jgi:hypothetical protein
MAPSWINAEGTVAEADEDVELGCPALKFMEKTPEEISLKQR